ncbi:DHA2 family efflux MFS transporter permease subunit [Streptomyces radicis]|uniref:DHA2 family efflux MFS transporter permease subunit n=1 Tax=Streptomyces radicis TaxID=1750517 RepID=A0A3A9W636_9ACTN|nr:DHA2 family efflux MFS transporter permease subunit [Streptomyces radicis]RKN08152.1 DHA2 family efflux MFS transporter permease subunit [Streptomyces radicis]RKN20507.1 DHA2 family efflux MFS transporter permease subunit [Streptomyces radicis]
MSDNAPPARPGAHRALVVWTLLITGAATFMASLDNLVVTTALPVIRDDLGGDLADLEWIVNGYTLPFACLLLLGAALGDRFGRRRIFGIGVALFTLSSAAAALAGSPGALIAARAAQGAGAAILLPLSLTLISAAVPPARRGAAFGIWGAVNGLAIASGPLVGGAITEHLTWQWIFWLNIPIGIALLPLVHSRLVESRGPNNRLDLIGAALASGGLFGIVLSIVRGHEHGWTSGPVLAGFAVGAVLLVAFVLWELRTPRPMLPMRFFRSRSFAAINVASLLMYLGMFGSIFLLTQFLQLIQGYSPMEAGLRMLPWTAMPMVVAPLAGALSDRVGGRPIVATGLALMAAGLGWFALLAEPDVSYASQVPAFVICGIGMAMFFAPTGAMVMGTVSPEEEGIASGVNNALREVGGALGVAVLASVFASQGGYETPRRFTDGLVPALWIGVAALLAATVAILFTTNARRPGPEPDSPLAKEPPRTPVTTTA